jgi:hypothetical protein
MFNMRHRIDKQRYTAFVWFCDKTVCEYRGGKLAFYKKSVYVFRNQIQEVGHNGYF